MRLESDEKKEKKKKEKKMSETDITRSVARWSHHDQRLPLAIRRTSGSRMTVIESGSSHFSASLFVIHRNKGVRWTLYPDFRVTWNEASQFCFERGGHLPVTNNDVTMAALQDRVAEWENNNVM